MPLCIISISIWTYYKSFVLKLQGILQYLCCSINSILIIVKKTIFVNFSCILKFVCYHIYKNILEIIV